MRLTFPDLHATCEPHTVETAAGLMAGFLVRDSGSRRELGYIWTANGSAWRWRTPDASHFGERSSQKVAVEVLRDAFDLARGVDISAPRLPFTPPSDTAILSAWRTADAYRTPSPRRSAPKAAPTPTPTPAPTPAAPARRVVWADEAPTGDITAAMRDAFTQHKAK